MLLFGGNFLNGRLTNTGAFEVFDGHELIYSKLGTGAFPNPGVLVDIFALRFDNSLA